MNGKIVKTSTVLLILLLVSGCSGIKPFFQVNSLTVLKPSYSAHLARVKNDINNHGYVPASGALYDEDGTLIKRKQYKFSVSFPATMKLEFR